MIGVTIFWFSSRIFYHFFCFVDMTDYCCIKDQNMTDIRRSDRDFWYMLIYDILLWHMPGRNVVANICRFFFLIERDTVFLMRYDQCCNVGNIGLCTIIFSEVLLVTITLRVFNFCIVWWILGDLGYISMDNIFIAFSSFI